MLLLLPTAKIAANRTVQKSEYTANRTVGLFLVHQKRLNTSHGKSNEYCFSDNKKQFYPLSHKRRFLDF